MKNSEDNILVISYQVLNEVTNVLKKKKFSESDIRLIIENMSKLCVIQDYSKEIAILASELRENHKFSFWDSHVVASAMTAKCDYLASEDMHSRQAVNTMVIINIFAD